MTLWQDGADLFDGQPEPPDHQSIDKGHGRLEARQIRVSDALVGYSAMPGMAQVAELRTRRVRLKSGEVTEQVRDLFTSLPPTKASPARLLALSRGHWRIENRLFPLKDDSFGEDRCVLQRHCSGIKLSALHNAALMLLRGSSRLWRDRDPMTARAEYVGAWPSAILTQRMDS